MPILDPIQDIKKQVMDNISSLQKQRAGLIAAHSIKIASIDNQLADFENKLSEIKKYVKKP